MLAPTRAQARAAVAAAVASALAVAAVAPFAGVRALEGGLGDRETEGLLCGALVLAIMALAAVAHARAARRMGGGAPLPRRVRTGARRGRGRRRARPVRRGGRRAQRLDLRVVGRRVGGAADPGRAATVAATGRSRCARSAATRWTGIGAGGFGVAWLRERTIDERVQDAHSLYIETAAELGLVGLALLVTFLGGVVAAARRAIGSDRVLAAGPAAAGLVWALHAGVDWDWEMPALTGVAVLLAGILLGGCERAATREGGGELARAGRARGRGSRR